MYTSSIFSSKFKFWLAYRKHTPYLRQENLVLLVEFAQNNFLDSFLSEVAALKGIKKQPIRILLFILEHFNTEKTSHGYL